MQASSLPDRPPVFWIRLGYAVAGLLLATSAHFAGFLSQIPIELTSMVAASMATAFSATFVFYVLSAAILARILATFSGMAMLVGTLLGRIVFPGSKLRRTKALIRTMSEERALFYVSFALLFALFFADLYLDLVSAKAWSAAIVVAFLLPPWLLDRPTEAIARMRGRLRKSRLYRSLLITSVGIAVGLIVAAAYGAGMLRHTKLWRSNTLAVQDSRFFGKFNVLLISGDRILMVEHHGLSHRYILATPSTIYYELPIGTGPIGSPPSGFSRPLQPAEVPTKAPLPMPSSGSK
jgi:hypothetical protein